MTITSLVKHEFALIPSLTKCWSSFQVFIGLGPALLDSKLSLKGFDQNGSFDFTFPPFTINSDQANVTTKFTGTYKLISQEFILAFGVAV